MAEAFEWISSAEGWIALLTLTVLEIVQRRNGYLRLPSECPLSIGRV